MSNEEAKQFLYVWKYRLGPADASRLAIALSSRLKVNVQVPITVLADPTLPPGTAELRDSAGKVLVRITNIEAPEWANVTSLSSSRR